MGIVNITDDSFYPGSRCAGVDEALDLVRCHMEGGASIVDVGACSSRPGSLPVGPDEEWKRLEPVLKSVRDAFPSVGISVDTYWSEVVDRTYDLIGNFIVNDISAGEDDPLMLETVGKLGLTYVAMHKKGDPQRMQQLASYDDVIEDVFRYFLDFSVKAEENCIADWIVDPGFGFAKTVEQNYELLRGLSRFSALPGNRKILVGVSRKSMIYRPLSISPSEALPATQVVHLAALQNGADILRVHDVAEAARTVSLYRMLD